MKYTLSETISATAGGCLVAGVFSDTDTTFSIGDSNLFSELSGRLQEPGDLVWQTLWSDHSLLLVHCGKKNEFTQAVLRKRLQDIIQALLSQKIDTATLCLPNVSDLDVNRQVTQMLLQIDSKLYQLLDYKTVNKKNHALKNIQFYLPGATQEALDEATSIAKGIALAKTLANLPANRCTPSFIAGEALALAKTFKTIKTTVMDRAAMQKMGMGAFLAVAQGTAEPPCFIEVSYQGGTKNTSPVVLVGKGITFDSGGLTIKPGNVMDEMKYDMAGAASVLGTIEAAARMKLPVNVVGLLACSENMPGGKAIKPGDIVTSLSGQTVEILNTDAEGRLVLADALTYAERFNPKFVLDMATLTGAIIVALGHINTGFMTCDDDLADMILKASKDSQDKCWRMPLEDDYQDALDSPLADMINSRFDRSAGSITAACFLSRFTKKYRWAHLDIAGTAWITGKNREATGRPVALLVEILKQVAHAS